MKGGPFDTARPSCICVVLMIALPRQGGAVANERRRDTMDHGCASASPGAAVIHCLREKGYGAGAVYCAGT